MPVVPRLLARAGAAFAAVALLTLGLATPAHAVPSLTVSATITGGPFTAVGQPIDVELHVTNDGTVNLTNVMASINGWQPCPNFDLAVGAGTTCVASVVLTQADLDAGTRAIPISAGNLSASASDSVNVALTQNAELTTSASSDVATVEAVGDPVEFTVDVTNSGNVTLNGLAVAMGATGLTCLATSLAPGDATTCTTTYLTTQADLDARRIQPSFAASASSPSNVVASSASSVTVTAPALLAATGGTLSVPALASALAALLVGVALALAGRRGSRLA